jgi:hypothetical protein
VKIYLTNTTLAPKRKIIQSVEIVHTRKSKLFKDERKKSVHDNGQKNRKLN